MPIPFVDLQAEYALSRTEIDANIHEIISRCAFIGGDAVKSFAAEMATHQGAMRVVTTGCGTSALTLTLKALGIGNGDEVITSPATAIPTTEAITLCGARVVFADITPGSYNLDPAQVETAITPNTKAILPVHLYGIPCDLDGLMEVAKKHSLLVLEDCAQAQGARWRGERVGSFGDAAAFSFFPSKNLGAFGDGGAMCARDAAVMDKTNMLANHGKLSKFEHAIEGTNSRLDGVQAAVLRAKLPLLDERNARRREAAAWYYEAFAEVAAVSLPQIPEAAEPVWHIFPVRVADRNGLQAHLKAAGIGCGVHYAMALNLQSAYAYLDKPAGSFPESEAAFREQLSLPMFPAIAHEQVEEVATAVKEFISTAHPVSS